MWSGWPACRERIPAEDQRASVKKLLGGSKEGVLDAANEAEDDLSRKFAEANVNDKANNNNNNNGNKWKQIPSELF